MLSLSDDQARWARFRQSGLAEPFASPAAAAMGVAGVQAQIVPAAALAIWNRCPSLTYREFENAVYRDRTLIKLWGQRSTLHIYAARDWALVHSAFHQRPTGWARYWARVGNGDEYVATVDRAAAILLERGVIGRNDMRAAGIEERYLSGWGGIFDDLVRRGIACHAAPAGGEARIAHRAHWLPQLEWEPLEVAPALVEMVRRYFRAYGPSTVHDVARWGAQYAGPARAAVAALEGELSTVDVAGVPMLALSESLDRLAEPAPPPKAWPVHLLFRFDPLVFGHREKDWLIDMAHYARVWRPAGHIEGTVLEAGRMVGTWGYERKPAGLRIVVVPFGRLSAATRKAVEREAKRVARFFDLPLLSVEWGATTPIERQ